MAGTCPNHPNKIVKAKGLCEACYCKMRWHTDPEYRDRKLRGLRVRQLATPPEEKRAYYWANRDRILGARRERTKSLKSTMSPADKSDWGRDKRYKEKYGISLEDFNSIFWGEQKGSCAICGKYPDRPVIDHCHISKIVRGVLCVGCNTLVGYLEVKRDILPEAEAYIRHYRENPRVPK